MNHNTYSEQLSAQMKRYLKFMKEPGPDDQMINLSKEVARIKGDLDRIAVMTELERRAEVEFDIEIIESEIGGKTHFLDGMGHRFNRAVNRSNLVKNTKPRKSKYVGIYFQVASGRYSATIRHKGITYLNQTFVTEELAVKERDRIILKFGLPHPLHELKRNLNET